MDYFAGLDVSVKETSVCIVDDAGRIVREAKVLSEPEALLQVLMVPGQPFKRIGLEAGPLSQWLFSALAEAGLPVICVETRHMRAVLKAQINKRTYRVAQLMMPSGHAAQSQTAYNVGLPERSNDVSVERTIGHGRKWLSGAALVRSSLLCLEG